MWSEPLPPAQVTSAEVLPPNFLFLAKLTLATVAVAFRLRPPETSAPPRLQLCGRREREARVSDNSL